MPNSLEPLRNPIEKSAEKFLRTHISDYNERILMEAAFLAGGEPITLDHIQTAIKIVEQTKTRDSKFNYLLLFIAALCLGAAGGSFTDLVEDKLIIFAIFGCMVFAGLFCLIVGLWRTYDQ